MDAAPSRAPPGSPLANLLNHGCVMSCGDAQAATSRLVDGGFGGSTPRAGHTVAAGEGGGGDRAPTPADSSYAGHATLMHVMAHEGGRTIEKGHAAFVSGD